MDINQHYSQHMDETTLLNQLRQQYPDGPTLYQLAPIDQLHIGGIKASEKLLQQLQQLQPSRILEIGSGAGGLMRMIARQFSAEIIGIDITHGFNRLNRALTALTDTPVFPVISADAQQLPFPDNSFDCIVFQHSLLNIPETERCLQECLRVLGANGTLLLHEVLQGPNPRQMRYPVPWASTAAQSHLITVDALSTLLQSSGFHLQAAENWSEEARQWRQRQAEKEKQHITDKQRTTPLISPIQILGEDFKKMGPNVIANLSADAVQVWQLSCTVAV